MSSRDRDEIAHALIEDREVSWAEVGRRVERHRTTIMREGWQPSGNGCHRRSDLGLPNLNMTPTVAIGRPEELREFLVLGEQIRRELVEHRIVPERPRRQVEVVDLLCRLPPHGLQDLGLGHVVGVHRMVRPTGLVG